MTILKNKYPQKNSSEFYIAEESVAYNTKKPYIVHYDNPKRSIKLFKGDCIEIINEINF
jgi:hypothetical protein